LGSSLVIVGDRPFAEVAYEYFTHDSAYDVVAFTVEREYLRAERLLGLPVIPFEELESRLAPETHSVFAAVVFRDDNRLRRRLWTSARSRGYRAASYVSTRAMVAHTARIGEHCFVCEDTVVQPHAVVGSNVVLWSGTYVGSRAVVEDDCFTLPHAVICDSAHVGRGSVIGPNATVGTATRLAGARVVEPAELVQST
jgi:UDP-3-O-[3-hydroxymyristoyl] glucosamine N-acyltransferase